jgi:hypothetical protein
MRANILLLLGLLCTAFLACADEQFPVLKVGGDTYSNVTVTSVSATDIYFSYADGIGSAKLKDLEPALQQHFHFDPSKAKAAQQNSGSAGNPPDFSNPQATLNDAMARVRFIINQPVPQFPMTPEMDVAYYPDGWFHPGAIRPDFNTVDVRTTQDTHYAEHRYATSALNPGVCFPGDELEFNSMTKYFYTDRSLPKKKLTGAEMIEINRLYRIIGTCEEKLAHIQSADVASNSGQPQDAASAVNPTIGFLSAHKTTIVSAAAGFLLVLMFILNFCKKPA